MLKESYIVVDSLGRLCVPREVQKEMGLKDGQRLQVDYCDNSKISLRVVDKKVLARNWTLNVLVEHGHLIDTIVQKDDVTEVILNNGLVGYSTYTRDDTFSSIVSIAVAVYNAIGTHCLIPDFI